MAEPSTPVSEAMERLGDAAVANVADAVARSTSWAAAVGAAATSPTPASTVPADELARTAMSAWVGGLRAIAVTAAAVTDAAAILSCPPGLVEYYVVDLADQLPDRAHPVTLAVTNVAWASENSSGAVPVVTITDAQPIGVPPQGGSDVVEVRVRPSVAPSALMLTVTVNMVSTPATEPVVLEIRLSPENLVVDQ